MIYLFEDREDRKKQFLGNETLHPMIQQKPFNCPTIDIIDSYIQDNYKDADAILLHKSYQLENKDFTIENIKSGFVSLLKIPVVLFSGGSKSSLIKEKDLITAEINSGVMYRNLNEFITSFQKDGIIRIPILVYGKNYQLNQLLEMQTKICSYMFDRHIDDTLTHTDKRKLLQIINDVETDNLLDDINKLSSWIESNYNTISFEVLNNQVQKLINIHAS